MAHDPAEKGAVDQPVPGPDFEKLAQNATILMEQAGKFMSAYSSPRDGENPLAKAGEASDLVKTMGKVAEYWLSDPKRTLEAQTRLGSQMLDLWGHTLRRLNGEEPAPIVTPEPRDQRFKDPDWSQNPYYDFLKQAYLISSRWADDLVSRSAIDEHLRHKAEFYTRQIAGAISPSNFVATNPELLRATLNENGENLVRGMQMLAEDVASGQGEIRVRQSDLSRFEVGVNLAMTPGEVVFRNDLIELIQYRPSTDYVFGTPVLLIPPWINKFYILDLNEEKSFVRWCVGQGLTVFIISWVNPDERHAGYDFERYMHEGILAAAAAVEAETGVQTCDALGYCVGGTMLAVTLGWLAAKGQTRFRSATFLTTQVDFTHAGDLKVFVDEEQIRGVEEVMERHGYLPGAKMANAFNMLRPQDLIWPYVINSYLKGQQPSAFDLLFWNADATRMSKANHQFYLRNCYLENRLSQGTMPIGDTLIDLSKVTLPIYNLAAREDHIAPARSVFLGSASFGGPVRYVVSGSGHIAGVVNPPSKGKYQYWTGGPATGSFEDWLTSAAEHPGSWWPDWKAWLTAGQNQDLPARAPGFKSGSLGPAPGTYVKVRA